jgi:hypothetical protein
VKVEIMNEDVVWRDLDGEIIILNLATGFYYGLEGSANDMWRVLNDVGSTEGVVDALAAEFDVGRDRLAKDVNDLVRRLAEKSIVRVVPA